MTCPICDGPMAEDRTVCSRSCAARLSHQQRRERVQVTLEEAEFMLSAGFAPDYIANRLGSTVRAISRSARRHECWVVSAAFSKAENYQRRHPCADCGAPGVWAGSTRCRRCENVSRSGRAA